MTTTNTETWWEAAIWNPTDFKPLEVSAHTSKTVTVKGLRKQRITDNRIIARTRDGLKLLLIEHFEREARKYEGWARQKRQYADRVRAVTEGAP